MKSTAASDPKLLPESGSRLNCTLRMLANRVLPAALREHASICRELRGHDRYWYLRLLALRTLGGRSSNFLGAKARPRAIMFVCHGNIIRSAFSEVLLRAELARLGVDDVEVISAGTDATQDREADRRAIALAPEFSVSLDEHRATRVTETLMECCDLVCAMDFINEAKLAARFPRSRDKIGLLDPFPGEAAGVAVPDPYTGTADDVRACYRVLEGRIRHFAKRLADVNHP